MFCSNCGAELPEDSTDYSQCGAKVNGAPPSVPPAPAKAKPRLKWLPVVVGGVAIILVGMLLSFLVGVTLAGTNTVAFAAVSQIVWFFSIFVGGAIAGAMAGFRGALHGLLAGLLMTIIYIIFIICILTISESYFFAWNILSALISTAITLGLSALGGAFGRWLRARHHLRRSMT